MTTWETEKHQEAYRDWQKRRREVRGLISLQQSLSAELPEDRSDLTRIPLGTVAMSSAPGNSCLASPNSGLGPASCCISFLPWWKMTKVLFFPTSSHFESHQGHLSCNAPVASFWGSPTNRQGETDSPSVANPDVQKLVETLITKGVERKVWEKEEKDNQCT
ncbi:hypothetical protein HPG69_003333 [Diceros bicornis minor]|uniref:Uncharacterized protein n=1 Tax=Diceros bicornis minor TaxID=77932 RepID=A0A7J7E8K9_DICBM|nr:hypothetical protein HPG69_003333 [Diceros bicornis minor]